MSKEGETLPYTDTDEGFTEAVSFSHISPPTMTTGAASMIDSILPESTLETGEQATTNTKRGRGRPRKDGQPSGQASPKNPAKKTSDDAPPSAAAMLVLTNSLLLELITRGDSKPPEAARIEFEKALARAGVDDLDSMHPLLALGISAAVFNATTLLASRRARDSVLLRWVGSKMKAGLDKFFGGMMKAITRKKE
jgi:hypothetical protein